MKKLLPILASIALALPAFGQPSQGVAVRAVDGYSTNQKLTNSTLSKPSVVDNIVVPKVYSNEVEATNASTLTLKGGGVEMTLGSGAVTVGSPYYFSAPFNVYDATTWNNSTRLATENDIRDKIEAIVAAAGITADTATNIVSANAIGKLDDSGTNTTLHVPVIVSNNIVLVSGVTQTPYATLALANTAAASGDTILVSGSNFVAASVAIKGGVAIKGNGRNSILAGTGLAQPLLIITNDNIRLESFHVQSETNGLGIIAAGPFTITNLVMRDVSVFAYENGLVWKNGSGTGANIIKGDFYNLSVSTMTNNAGVMGIHTETATNSVLNFYNCSVFGQVDGIFAGGNGGEVRIFGGNYRSETDAISANGAHVTVIGARAQGNQSDIYRENGTLTPYWVEYLNDVGQLSGAHRIPNALIISGEATSNYLAVAGIITGTKVSSPDFTNSSLSDALVAVDANGKEVEVVIGSGLSYTAATRTLVNTGGAGSGDTNGISYVEGSDLIPAVAVSRDAGDNHVIGIYYTNGVFALVITNQDTASSIYHRFMNGHVPFRMTEGGGIFLNSELDLQLSSDSVLALQANVNVRTLNNTNGDTVVDFSGDEVVIDTVNVQQFNINNISVTNDLAVTNNLIVHGTITGDGSGLTNIASSFGITIDGDGSAITTGIKGDIQIPFACTITGVTMLADQTGSLVVDVWKDTYANYPPTDADSITASAPPTISAAIKSEDNTLTGWTTSVTAGDTIRFNVDSTATITRATLVIKVTR